MQKVLVKLMGVLNTICSMDSPEHLGPIISATDRCRNSAIFTSRASRVTPKMGEIHLLPQWERVSVRQ